MKINNHFFLFFYIVAASTARLSAAESRISATQGVLASSPFGFFLTAPEITLRLRDGISLTLLEPQKKGVASEVTLAKQISSVDKEKEAKIVDKGASYVQKAKEFEASFPDGVKKDETIFKLSQADRHEWNKLIDFFIDEFKKQRLNKAKQVQIKSFLKQILWGLFAFEESLKIRSYDVLVPEDLDLGSGIVVDTGIEALSLLDEKSVEFKNLLTIILSVEKIISSLNSMPELGLLDHAAVNPLIKEFLATTSFSEPSDSIQNYLDLMIYFIIRETVQFRWTGIINFLMDGYIKNTTTGAFNIFINSFSPRHIGLVDAMLRQIEDISIFSHYFINYPEDSADSLMVHDEKVGSGKRSCQFLKDFYKKIYTFLNKEDSKYLEIDYRGFTGKLPSELENSLENVSSKQQLGRLAVSEKASMPEESPAKASSSKKKKKKSDKKSETLLTKTQKLDLEERDQGAAAPLEEVLLEEKEDSSDKEVVLKDGASDKKKKRKNKKKHAAASMASVLEENNFAGYLQNDSTISYTKSARAWLKNPQEILERDGYLEDLAPRGSIRETRRNVFLNYKHLFNGDEERAKQVIIDSHVLPELLDKILLQMPTQELPDDAFKVESPLLKKNRDGSFDFGIYELFFHKIGDTAFKVYHKVFKSFERHRILGNIPAEFADVIAHEEVRGALPLDEDRQDPDGSAAESDWVPAAGEWIQELLPTMNGLKFMNSKNGLEYTLMGQ